MENDKNYGLSIDFLYYTLKFLVTSYSNKPLKVAELEKITNLLGEVEHIFREIDKNDQSD